MTTPTALIARLATAALAARGLHPHAPTRTVGTIRLLPHQNAAVQWLLPRLHRLSGALLADPPGLGKTFVALAVAHDAETVPLVIAPAALRTRWLDAARETGVPIRFVSTERLSAPQPLPVPRPTLVIIDEAHHLRTGTTRRFHRTDALCQRAQVLLLSATPIHNSAGDLQRLTSLFHLPASTPALRTIRRQLTLRRSLAQIRAAAPRALDGVHIPAVQERPSIAVRARPGDRTAAILAIPPLDAADRDSHALRLLGMIHAARSSDAALARRLRHRIARTIAIEVAAAAGLQATQQIARAFTPVGDDVQLAMPALFGGPALTTDATRAELGARHQRSALERLLVSLDGAGDRDRAAVLRRLARWAAAPVVAFTQFRATAAALHVQLRHVPGIALLDGSTARIASGVIPREEAIARLLGTEFRAPQDRVRLLITTDVLSEGLSLAGVRTIVHLDTPWTAARLEQRVGRAARIGAPVASVRSVELPAPVPASMRVALDALLTRKRIAMRTITRDDEDTIVALLANLARCASARGARWETRVARERSALLIVALVRFEGRRTLVALDGAVLRAPRQQDWMTLISSAPAPRRAGAIRRLRRALLRAATEREMQRFVSTPEARRRLARAELDRAVAAAHVSRRAALAGSTSDHRRQRSTATRRPADDEQLALESGVDDRAILVYAGVAVWPLPA